MKAFMNHLLVADTFDNFLLEEATISTANVYQIDGHINKEFYATDELTEAQSIPYDFAQWKDMKPLCFNLIKGKRTPLFFKFVLHLKPEQVSKLMVAGGSNISAEEIKALVKKAKSVIPKKVKHYAPIVGVDYERIFIRTQRTRWGSCSLKKNLNFNCILMLFPDEVIDSVIVHELCHLKHMNHSPAFYAEVERVFPDYKKCRKWLKENGGMYLCRIP